MATGGNPDLGNGKMNLQLAMMVALRAVREPVVIHLRNHQRSHDGCRRLCAGVLYDADIQLARFEYD